MIKKCLKCGHEKFEEKEQVFRDGTKHIARICMQCGKHNSFKSKSLHEIKKALESVLKSTVDNKL